MTYINKLGDCKTLAQFNEFSKLVGTDMNSAGRSFTYLAPNGKQRSYTMNQIVRKFDKCIAESKKTEIDNFCAEMKEGIESIDQWNTQADSRENTSMLGVRKWLGNWWYSITHSGFNKDETLAKIKSTYAETLNNEVMKIEAANDALIAKYGIFGSKQWQECGVTIGNVPVLPEGIEKIIESPCPIWGHKKVSETHRLVLMPKTVNGKPLTLNSFGEIAKKSFPNTANGYRYISSNIAKDVGDTPIDESYWVLMTKEPIPGSFNISYAAQQTMITKLEESSESDYEAPLLLEAAVFALTQYFQDETRLFANTYTRCQENVQGFQMGIGGFAPAGLSVLGISYGHSDVGVAARRKF